MEWFFKYVFPVIFAVILIGAVAWVSFLGWGAYQIFTNADVIGDFVLEVADTVSNRGDE